MRGLGLRPFAPCHVGATRLATGDLLLRWLRRDRAPDADDWTGGEVVLSEAREAYEIDILSADGTVLRTVSGLTVSSYLYPASCQAADFGAALGPGDRVTVAIFQMSDGFGRGRGKTATLYL